MSLSIQANKICTLLSSHLLVLIVHCTVPPESIDPSGQGNTSSLPRVVVARHRGMQIFFPSVKLRCNLPREICRERKDEACRGKEQ